MHIIYAKAFPQKPRDPCANSTDRFDLSSIEEVLPFYSAGDLLKMERRREGRILPSRVFFVEGAESRLMESTEAGSLPRSKERRRSFPRINITSRRFFLRIFSIFRIIRFPIYDGGAWKIERHPASIRPRRRKNIQISRSLPRTRNDRIMKAHFVLDRSTWLEAG